MKVDLPDNELRTGKTNMFAAARIFCNSNNYSKVTGVTAWALVMRTLEYSNNMEKVLNILARVFRGWKMGKTVEVTREDPTAAELETSERMLLLTAMPASYSALDEGRLDSLLPKRDGFLLVTTGRIGEKSLSRLLGVASLPILLPNTRAAFLYMTRAHCGEDNLVHNSAVETLARSRSSVWIVRGKDLARKVCKTCPKCILRRKELSGQQIANIKPESLEVCRPWTYVSLDFSGPVVCKGVVNARARRKCWILVYCCRSTKAVCFLAVPGYDTESFLIRHE